MVVCLRWVDVSHRVPELADRWINLWLRDDVVLTTLGQICSRGHSDRYFQTGGDETLLGVVFW